jgi:site-specific recombinase XerD
MSEFANTDPQTDWTYPPVIDNQGDDDEMSDMIEAHLKYLEDEQKRSARTLYERRTFLTRADRELPRGLGDIYTTDILAFLDDPDWTRWTARTYCSHFRGLYSWAYREGWMSADPTAGMRSPRRGVSRPKPVPAHELAIALAGSPEPWYSCIMIGVGAGLRASELAELRREDVTPEYVHVRCGKGGKERFVDTCECLWEFVSGRPPGLLVRKPNGEGVTGKWLSSHQQEHWRSIGLPRWHLHRLRHTFCTTAWASGADPLAVRDLMGHESIVTTEVYSETPGGERRKAVSAVDALLREHQPVRTRLVPAAA